MADSRTSLCFDLRGLAEIAEFTGLSQWKVRELARDGKIPVAKVGSTFYARKVKLSPWIEQAEQKACG